MGGRGCGKSEFGAYYVLTNARAGEPWMCISPDYNVIEDTTWPTFERVAMELGKWIKGVKSPVPRVWFRTEDGGIAELVFKSAEKPEKLRGPSKAGLWFDEASVMCHDAFLLSIPVLRWNGTMGPCLLTFTPKGRRHWTFNVFYEEVTDDGELELLEEYADAGTDGAALLDDIDQYEKISEKWYRRKTGHSLVHATSQDNPFLPPEYVQEIGSHLSRAMRAQELSGQFIDLAGLFFQREWFYPLVNETPRVAQRVRYWDRAGTKGGGCYSAGVLMSRTDDGVFWVEDVQRGQWSSEERNRAIVETARRDAQLYGNTVQIWGEQEGGSAGKEISEQFIKMLAGYPVHRDIVGGKGTRLIQGLELPHKPKIIRSQGLVAQSEAGNVRVKRAVWTGDFLDELVMFPESDICDQVDAASGCLNKLCRMWTTDPGYAGRIETVADGERFGVHLDKIGNQTSRR